MCKCLKCKTSRDNSGLVSEFSLTPHSGIFIIQDTHNKVETLYVKQILRIFHSHQIFHFKYFPKIHLLLCLLAACTASLEGLPFTGMFPQLLI